MYINLENTTPLGEISMRFDVLFTAHQLTSADASPIETLRLSRGGDPASDPEPLSDPDSETDLLFLKKLRQ